MSDQIEQRSKLDRQNPKATYRFWETQPVAQFQHQTEEAEDDGPIDAVKSPGEVRAEPYPLQGQFEWSLCDLHNEEELKEVFDLLRLNYVEDDDEMFRFCYSREFIQWALCPPGHKKDWHLGVRVKETHKLVGLITGVPAELCVKDQRMKIVEINFLCIHKRLRSKRLAPLLIKEITRRINLHDIWQAAYTAGVVLPKPIATCRYWHRSINPKKLVEVGFSRLSTRMTMARLIKLHKLPTAPVTPGFREARAADFPDMTRLLNEYLSRYKLRQHFTEDDVRYFLTPRPDLVHAYVVEGEDGNITDFCSFYCLPSSILNHAKHTELRAAYMYYTAALKTPMKQLLNDALIMAHTHNFDVFNALDFLENTPQLLTDLKFGIGDGNLHYYLYNWRVSAKLTPRDVGLILM